MDSEYVVEKRSDKIRKDNTHLIGHRVAQDGIERGVRDKSLHIKSDF